MIIYAICLVVGLMFTLASAFLGHIFSGHDAIGSGGHAEGGMDTDGLGVSILSPTVLASFVTAFGAFGLIFTDIHATASAWISAPLSFVCSLFVALFVMWALNKVFRATQSSSEAQVAKLVGATAAVISPIPENGVGEISYVQAGSRYTAPARNEKGTAVPNGKTVKITRIVGTQYFVEPVN
jgi:membrane protein implicated in regulation of membrane protease activity